jgi:hypothetical protein
MNGAIVETDARFDVLQLRSIEMQSFAKPFLGKARGPPRPDNLYAVYCTFCDRHLATGTPSLRENVSPRARCPQCDATVDVLTCLKLGRCLCIPCLSKNGERCTFVRV